MSEQNYPAGGVGVAEPEASAEETSNESTRRGLLLGVLGLAVALVIGLAAYFLLFSGGSDDVATGPVTPAQPTAGAAAPSASPSAPASTPAQAVVPPTFSEDVGSDPFKPAVVAPSETADPSASGGTAGGTTGTTTGGTGAVVQLQLLSVADDSASLEAQVDGKAYKDLTVGSSFATYFKVYGIFDGRCAGFLYGDQTVALCEGDAASLTK